MFKQIIAIGLLLSCAQLKVVAQDKTSNFLNEARTQLGQKRVVLYDPEAAKGAIKFANAVCKHYNYYQQAYSSINKSVDKQKVKAEILDAIDENFKKDEHYEYIDNWNLEYYSSLIDAVLISNYCY